MVNREGRGSIFFLGSTDEILGEIRQRMAEDYPKLRVAAPFLPPTNLNSARQIWTR